MFRQVWSKDDLLSIFDRFAAAKVIAVNEPDNWIKIKDFSQKDWDLLRQVLCTPEELGFPQYNEKLELVKRKPREEPIVDETNYAMLFQTDWTAPARATVIRFGDYEIRKVSSEEN